MSGHWDDTLIESNHNVCIVVGIMKGFVKIAEEFYQKLSFNPAKSTYPELLFSVPGSLVLNFTISR